MTPEQYAAGREMERRLGKRFGDLSRAEVDTLFAGCLFWYMAAGMSLASLVPWIEEFYSMNADLLKALQTPRQ